MKRMRKVENDRKGGGGVWPLCSVSSPETICDMANLEYVHLSSIPQDNIVLSIQMTAIWDTLCSNTCNFISKSPPCGPLYLPL